MRSTSLAVICFLASVTLAADAQPATVVDIAVGSSDHTTLVTALKTADYVRSLQNAGPFTVFAPTNAAFDKLPKGTLEGLMKPESKDALQNILKYHVAVSVYEVRAMKEGMKLGVANGANVVFHVKDGKTYVNDAQILGSARAGNGIVHIVDGVLLPPTK
ncbi:MAG: fasciclin domain-containing protein [Archangium sp.]|nr:fasciclin domain-containing protein [Archangium sp.]